MPSRWQYTGFLPVQYYLESVGQYNTKFLPVQCKYYENTEHDFFIYNVVWSNLDNIAQGIFPIQCCPKGIKTNLNRIFSCEMCLELLWQQYLGFYLCNVFPRVLKQYWTGIFLVQCCLKSLGQHYKRFFLVQYCPRSIKATLTARKTIFSFSRRPEKMVFPKKLRWDMIFHVLSRKMVFLFPENMILRVGRKMKDDLS